MAAAQKKICDDIGIVDEGVTVIAYGKDGEKVIVPHCELNWRNPYDDDDDYDLPLFLSLKEISDQLIEKGYKPTFYVWCETGLSGKIYRYGNDTDDAYWTEHGETNGYA